MPADIRERIIRPGEPGTFCWLESPLTEEQARTIFSEYPVNLVPPEAPGGGGKSGVFVADRFAAEILDDRIIEDPTELSHAVGERVCEIIETIKAN